MSHPLIVIDPNGRKHRSLTKAEKATGIQRGKIRAMLDDPSSGWSYEGKLPRPTGRACTPGRPCYDPDGNYYESAKAASVVLGLAKTTVGGYCRHKRHGWYYADEPRRIAGKARSGWDVLPRDYYRHNPAW